MRRDFTGVKLQFNEKRSRLSNLINFKISSDEATLQQNRKANSDWHGGHSMKNTEYTFSTK